MRGVYRLLRLNRLIRGHRAKFPAAFAAHTLRLRHLAVRIDPVMACNLRCRMCHYSNASFVRANRGRFTTEEMERLAAMFYPLALMVVYGCGAEPTLYKDYPALVRLAKRHGVPNVGLVTNGQLLTAGDVDQLVEDGLDEIVLSVRGVTRATYEHFMPGAAFARLLAALGLVVAARERRHRRSPAIRVNYTVNGQDLAELASLFEVFGQFPIATLQVRPVMAFGGEYRTPLAPGERADYGRIVAALRTECARRSITALITPAETSYDSNNAAAAVLHAVQRHIRPSRVWRDDFDRRRESYRDYCARTGWARQLLRCAGSPVEAVLAAQHQRSAAFAARYEVSL